MMQEAAERATMKDSIMAAAARTELPSVRSPALRILLELSWDETLKMSLIENNIPEPHQIEGEPRADSRESRETESKHIKAYCGESNPQIFIYGIHCFVGPGDTRIFTMVLHGIALVLRYYYHEFKSTRCSLIFQRVLL